MFRILTSVFLLFLSTPFALALDPTLTPVSLEFIVFSQPHAQKPFHSNMDPDKYLTYLSHPHRDDYHYPTPQIDHLEESIDLSADHTAMTEVIRHLRRHGYHFVHKRWAIMLDPKTSNSWDIDTVLPAAKIQSADGLLSYHLRGKVILQHNHYFDLTTDITIEPTYSDGQIPNIDHQTEYRRLKSKQLHYLDHERIGILVKITPMPDTKKSTS